MGEKWSTNDRNFPDVGKRCAVLTLRRSAQESVIRPLFTKQTISGITVADYFKNSFAWWSQSQSH